jgi:hypothetical protein
VSKRAGSRSEISSIEGKGAGRGGRKGARREFRVEDEKVEESGESRFRLIPYGREGKGRRGGTWPSASSHSASVEVGVCVAEE